MSGDDFFPWQLPSHPEARRQGMTDAERLATGAGTLASVSGIDGSLWELSLVPFGHRTGESLQFSAPAGKSWADAHPFHLAAFLGAGLGRIFRRSIVILQACEVIGDERRVRLSVPVSKASVHPGGRTVLRAVESVFSPLANPALDADDVEETMARFLSLCRIAFDAGMPPLLIENTWDDGQFARELLMASTGSGVAIRHRRLGERAALRARPGHEGSSGGKAGRERRRMTRRLREKGDLVVEIASHPMDILVRFEEFLLLETRGWKGRKGTSIQVLKRTAAFARQSAMELARTGRCEVFSLRLDDRAIASAIVFNNSGNYFPWKIAFDERHAAQAPGLLLMHAITGELLGRKDFHLCDSLAATGNSWVGRFWPETVPLGRFVIAPDDAQADAIDRGIFLSGRLRALAKRYLRRS